MHLSKLLFVLLAVFSLSAAAISADHCLHTCKVDDRAYNLTRNAEGLMLFQYADAAGHATIGFGHLIKSGESFDEPITGDDAETLLESDEKGAEASVNRMVTVYLYTNQFDALVDFTFNLGAGTLQHSSRLLPAVNHGDDAHVPPAMMQYDKARVGGVLTVLKGLFSRRAAEARLYSDNPE